MRRSATSARELQELMAQARMDPGREEAFLRALLDATVYAHVPALAPPKGRMQFIQFTHPDTGRPVLPFFSDLLRAQIAADGRVGIVAMAGRELFGLTLGATLMLDPNDAHMAIYPEEIRALLTGERIGTFSLEHLEEDDTVQASPPSRPVDRLVSLLRKRLEAEQDVQAAYLIEIRRGVRFEDASLLAVIVGDPRQAERIARGCAQLLQAEQSISPLPVLITFRAPAEAMPEICRAGYLFYERLSGEGRVDSSFI